jgi:hypothetical protein
LLLEILEGRTLMTVQPTAVTLTPNPVEAIPFSNVIVATFITPGDPNANDFLAGSSISWGDSTPNTTPATGLTIVSLGTTTAGPQFAVEGSHTYAETFIGQTLPVTVTIHDNVNGTDTQVVSSAPILNAPLTASSAEPFAGVEGTALTSIPLASFSRASTNHSAADYVASVNWGDGTPIDPTGVITVTPGGGGTPDTIAVGGSHTYAHKGTYNVTVALTDHGSQTATAANVATIHGATLTSTLTTTLAAVAGSPLTNATVAAFSDSNPLAGPGDFSASVSWNGTTVPGTVIQTGSGTFSVLSSFTFPAPATNLPVVTTILETAGTTPASDFPTTLTNTGAVTATVLASPLILTASPISATAGVALLTGTTPAVGTLVATFYNTAGAGLLGQYSATVDFGDGQGVIAAQIVASGPIYSIYAPTAPAVVYARAGSFPVKTTLTDTVSGISASTTSTATVTPAAIIAGPTQPVVTATQQTRLSQVPVANFTDANILLPIGAFTASIDWGDGTPNSIGQVTQPGGVGTPYVVLGSHTYVDPTTPPATPDPITVTIQGGGASLVTTTTANVAASTIVGTPSPVKAVESVPLVNVVVATFTDSALPGPIGAYSATINWGTGSPTIGTIVPLGGNTFAVEGTFTYSGEFAPPQPPYAITTSISHNGVGAATVTSPVSITGATLSGVAIPVFATVGTPFTGEVAAFTDANPSSIASNFTATIHWGDGSTTAGTVAASGSGFVVTGADPVSTLGYVFQKAGTYADSVTVTSVSGSSFTAFATATVAPAKLTVVGATLTAPIFPAFTATTASPLGTITDADPAATLASYTVSINWGDGKVTPGSVADNTSGQVVILGTHQYASLGTYPVTISVVSSSGSSASAVSILTITDTPLVAGPPIVIQETVNKPFTAKVATFTNINTASAAADYSASIAWGDGTTSAGTVVKLADGSFAVVGSHTYTVANPGVPLPISTTVQDAGIGGSSVVIPGSAIVYDAIPITSPVTFTIPVDQQYTGPVATFLQNNLSPIGLQPGTTYASSIDWGDGTPPTSGTVVAIPGGFQVIGTHTYFDARTTAGSNVFPVRVAIGDNTGTLTFVTSAATVTDAAFTAGLDPATDTGISPIDGFTTDQIPSFRGVAEAGATVKIFAQALGAVTPTLVAVTTANGSGAWATPTALLANAMYTITASEVDGSGNTLSTIQAIPNANQGMLVVDTLAPRVANIIFTPKLGQFTVIFQGGLSGLDIQSLANANNYVLQKGGKSYGSLLVTAIDPGNPALPNDPAKVTVTINNGKKLGGGTYTLVIHSGGIRILAGAPLDGLYYGAFPSGDGIPGGNFVAQINFLHHKVSAPKTFIGTAKPIQGAPPLPSSTAKAASKFKAASLAPAQAVQVQSVPIPYDVQDAALESVLSTGTLTKKKKS